MACEGDLNLEATELRLGLPGTNVEQEMKLKSNKRSLLDHVNEDSRSSDNSSASVHAKKRGQESSPPTKSQVVGWPPVRSYHKNCLQAKKVEAEAGIYVKVSMDGAPYLRKIDLKVYKNYTELLKGLEDMFMFKLGAFCEREGYNGSEKHVPTYEDKDGDWMLVGDVPWNMFINSCKRLRIMRGAEAKGLSGFMY